MGRIEYHVIEAQTVGELEDLINAALNEGAILEGGIAIAISQQYQSFYQAYTVELDHDGL
jgi:hypothetical protein